MDTKDQINKIFGQSMEHPNELVNEDGSIISEINKPIGSYDSTGNKARITEMEKVQQLISLLRESGIKNNLSKYHIESEINKYIFLMEGLVIADIGVDIIGLDYRIHYQNQLLQNKFGATTDKLCYELYMGLQKPCENCPMLKAITEKSVQSCELQGVDSRFYGLTTVPLPNSDGSINKVIELVKDITEYKQVERELHQSRQRIIAVQESLRKEIAQQLHGTVQNKLIVLLHGLKKLEKAIPMRELATQIRDIYHKLEELLDKDMRPLSRRLYPSILLQGLVPALQSLVDHYEMFLHIELELDENLVQQEKDNRQSIPEQTRLSAYRIAEEALTNTLKHADAGTVNVTLKPSPSGWIYLSVIDDGKGFDTENITGGLGTRMMQDYAEVVDGEYAILSTEGKGTEVIVTLPLTA